MNFATDDWHGVRLLIVEDEYFLAQDLADRFERLGAEVLGPAGTVREALSLARSAQIDGAVLDVNLKGERVYPVADLLLQKQIPFVFASGYGGELEPDAYSHVPRCIKPVNFAMLVQALASQLKVANCDR
jgi:CheY-like chemotaxis protein